MYRLVHSDTMHSNGVAKQKRCGKSGGKGEVFRENLKQKLRTTYAARERICTPRGIRMEFNWKDKDTGTSASQGKRKASR